MVRLNYDGSYSYALIAEGHFRAKSALLGKLNLSNFLVIQLGGRHELQWMSRSSQGLQ